jgi:hypothetical protein
MLEWRPWDDELYSAVILTHEGSLLKSPALIVFPWWATEQAICFSTHCVSGYECCDTKQPPSAADEKHTDTLYFLRLVLRPSQNDSHLIPVWSSFLHGPVSVLTIIAVLFGCFNKQVEVKCVDVGLYWLYTRGAK